MSPTGPHLVTAADDGSHRLWRLPDLQQRPSSGLPPAAVGVVGLRPAPAARAAFSLSGNGSWLLAGGTLPLVGVRGRPKLDEPEGFLQDRIGS